MLRQKKEKNTSAENFYNLVVESIGTEAKRLHCDSLQAQLYVL